MAKIHETPHTNLEVFIDEENSDLILVKLSLHSKAHNTSIRLTEEEMRLLSIFYLNQQAH